MQWEVGLEELTFQQHSSCSVRRVVALLVGAPAGEHHSSAH